MHALRVCVIACVFLYIVHCVYVSVCMNVCWVCVCVCACVCVCVCVYRCWICYLYDIFTGLDRPAYRNYIIIYLTFTQHCLL